MTESDNKSLLEAMKKVENWLGPKSNNNNDNSSSPNTANAENWLGPTSNKDSKDPITSSLETKVMDEKFISSTPKNQIADTIFERLQTLAEKVGKKKIPFLRLIMKTAMLL